MPACNYNGGDTCVLLLGWVSRRALVLDSGFFVLQAIIQLSKVGCYAAVVIKKS